MKTSVWRAAVVMMVGVMVADAQVVGAQVIRKPKSLVITLDGCRGDIIEAGENPNMQMLVAGRWAEGYSCAYSFTAQTIRDAITVSGPNHTSIFTGVTAIQHGVIKNDDEQMRAVKHLDYLTILERGSREQVSREQVKPVNTAKLVQWKPDSLVPVEADYLVVAPDDENGVRAAAILGGGHMADGWKLGTDADAVFVFFDDVDGAGHGTRFAVTEPRYIQTVKKQDRLIGGMLEAIRNRPTFEQEDWMVVITSDHGGYLSRHGDFEADCYTIPLMVSSRHVKQGEMAAGGIGVGVGNVDVAATVLAHHGVDPSKEFVTTDGRKYRLDSVVRGKEVLPAAGAMPEEIDALTAIRGGEFSVVWEFVCPPVSSGKQTMVRLSGEGGKTIGGVEIWPATPQEKEPVALSHPLDLVITLPGLGEPVELMEARPKVTTRSGPIRLGRHQLLPGKSYRAALTVNQAGQARVYLLGENGAVGCIADDVRGRLDVGAMSRAAVDGEINVVGAWGRELRREQVVRVLKQ